MTSFDDTVVTLLLQPMGAGRITIDDVLRLAVELDDQPCPAHHEVDPWLADNLGEDDLLLHGKIHPEQAHPKQRLTWALGERAA